MIALLVSLIERIAASGGFDEFGDIVAMERRFWRLSFWSIRSDNYVITGFSVRLRKWYRLFSQTRRMPLTVCVECGAALMGENAIPDYEWVLECPKCGHPNDNPAWRE